MNNQLNAQHMNIRLETKLLYLRINFAILQNFPLQQTTEAFMHDVKTVCEPTSSRKIGTGQTRNTRPTWQQQLTDGCPKTTVKTSHCK